MLRHLALALLCLAFMALIGAMMLLPIALQDVRGMSTLQSGLMLLPGALAMGLLGPAVGRLYDRVASEQHLQALFALKLRGYGLSCPTTGSGPVRSSSRVRWW